MIVQTKNEDLLYFWDAIKHRLSAEEFNATGVSHLYYCYRVAGVNATTAISEPMEPWSYFWTKLSKVPWGRHEIVGLNNHSLWMDGAPLPSYIPISSHLMEWKISSLSGAFPKKLPSATLRCKFYGSSMSAPAPKSGTEVVYVPPSEFYIQKVDCVWNPPDHAVSSLTCDGIAVPVSTPDQVVGIVSKFVKIDGWKAAVTFGAKPVVWVKKLQNGLKRSQLLPVVQKLAVSSLWMPIYNLSQSIMDVPDIWKIEVDGTACAHRVSTLSLIVYVPLQTKLPKYGRADDWEIPELDIEDDEGSMSMFEANVAAKISAAEALKKQREKGEKSSPDVHMDQVGGEELDEDLVMEFGDESGPAGHQTKMLKKN